VIHGGAGDDYIGTIIGSSGSGNVIFGDDGNDVIFMGGGEAFVSGGAGSDQFRYFRSSPTTVDDFLSLATDFDATQDTAMGVNNSDWTVYWNYP